MTDVDLPRFGAALFVLGLVWAVALFVLVGDVAALAALFIASVGLLVISITPGDDGDSDG